MHSCTAAPLALPTLSSRALLCSAGEPATKHFVKQGSISITPGFERARRAARRKMNRPWILSHGLISGPQLRASGPVVPRRPTAASGWLTGHPFRNFRYGQGLGPKSGRHTPWQALYSAYGFVLPGFPQVRHGAPNLPNSRSPTRELSVSPVADRRSPRHGPGLAQNVMAASPYAVVGRRDNIGSRHSGLACSAREKVIYSLSVICARNL